MAREEPSAWQVVTRFGILGGLALLALGAVVRDIRARALVETDYISIGLWVAGGVLVLVGAVSNRRMLLGLLRGRRTAEGMNFGAVVLLSLALAALLCYITSRRFARMDWTGKGKYRLHSQTINILRSLKKDVDITVVYQPPQTAYSPLYRWLDTVNSMLEEFKAYGSRVKVKQLNWTSQQQEFAELLHKIGEDSLTTPCVVFATADSHEVVPFAKIIHSSGPPQAPTEYFTGEDAFAGALKKLVEREKTPIYFLTGHGERPLEAGAMPPGPTGQTSTATEAAFSLERLVRELEKDNYEAKPLNLAKEGSVPDDCSALVIAGPRTPLAESEIRAIEDYLDERDGGVIVMVDSELFPKVNSNLEDLLGRYGIEARTDAVGISVMQDVFGRQVPMLAVMVAGAGMQKHPATADLGNYTLWFERPCPLQVDNPRPEPNLKAEPLLTGLGTTWGETDYKPGQTKSIDYDPQKDVPRPTVVGAVVQPAPPPSEQAVQPEGAEPPGPKIVALGSSLSVTNAVVEQHPANLYLFVNAVNWMAGKLHMLGIPPKTMEERTVWVSPSALAASRYIFIGVLPGCIVALGIAVWVFRRR